MSMFKEARQVIDKYLKKDDWFVWATMLRGHVTLPVFQSLESYWPGVLTLIGKYDTFLHFKTFLNLLVFFSHQLLTNVFNYSIFNRSLCGVCGV